MTRDEHRNIISQLMGMVTPENQATASDLLSTLSDDYGETLTTIDSVNADVTRLTANNETLRQVNAKLFLKVGETDKNAHNMNTPEQPNQPETPAMTFEELFNEKGGLK